MEIFAVPEPSFIQLVHPQGQPVTIAQLMATYPAGESLKGKYAQVTDLWGANIYGVMRCGYNGRIYYWEPTTQPQNVGLQNIAGDMTLQPLTSCPITELTGNIPALTTYNVTMGTNYAWPGAVREFRGSLTTLLGTLNLIGVGSTLNLVLGGTRRIVCYDNGSALVWRPLT